jgi:hypothetical protein
MPSTSTPALASETPRRLSVRLLTPPAVRSSNDDKGKGRVGERPCPSRGRGGSGRCPRPGPVRALTVPAATAYVELAGQLFGCRLKQLRLPPASRNAIVQPIHDIKLLVEGPQERFLWPLARC